MRPKSTKWRWFQYSLRTMSVLILAAGIGLGWYVNRARCQRDLYQAIYRSNSSAYYDYQIVDELYDPQQTSWASTTFNKILGTDFVHPVVKLNLWDDIQQGRADARQVDDFCQRLRAFPQLRSVCLGFGTDGRLVGIGRSKHLRRLEVVNGEAVTDQGIAGLTELRDLRYLDVSTVPISEAGWQRKL